MLKFYHLLIKNLKYMTRILSNNLIYRHSVPIKSIFQSKGKKNFQVEFKYDKRFPPINILNLIGLNGHRCFYLFKKKSSRWHYHILELFIYSLSRVWFTGDKMQSQPTPEQESSANGTFSEKWPVTWGNSSYTGVLLRTSLHFITVNNH